MKKGQPLVEAQFELGCVERFQLRSGLPSEGSPSQGYKDDLEIVLRFVNKVVTVQPPYPRKAERKEGGPTGSPIFLFLTKPLGDMSPVAEGGAP